MRRFALGGVLFIITIGIAGSAAAECFTIIAITPSGKTFPCTICVQDGRPTSAVCF